MIWLELKEKIEKMIDTQQQETAIFIEPYDKDNQIFDVSLDMHTKTGIYCLVA